MLIYFWSFSSDLFFRKIKNHWNVLHLLLIILELRIILLISFRPVDIAVFFFNLAVFGVGQNIKFSSKSKMTEVWLQFTDIEYFKGQKQIYLLFSGCLRHLQPTIIASSRMTTRNGVNIINLDVFSSFRWKEEIYIFPNLHCSEFLSGLVTGWNLHYLNCF